MSTTFFPGLKVRKYSTHCAISRASFCNELVPQPLYELESKTSTSAQSGLRLWAMVDGYLNVSVEVMR